MKRLGGVWQQLVSFENLPNNKDSSAATSYRQIPSWLPKSKQYLNGIVRVKWFAGFDYAEGDMN
jgi:hypothetical protein